ncbi:IS1182 family transposase [Simplicispira suum]|uniref:IS5/IS1182 family transposase n=1 Tax=Simplicispira suum TaxID=2109915 RepID=A0A2S0N6L4_9BURK|nr:IS1182 family transposase [Simplicispira suum]AVO43583.1 IS5/IS1182 family transposase [Simplicispira suum]
MSRFVPVDRETAYLLPPSVDEWLPKDHLARFVVEVIEQLDLSDLLRQYAGRGSAAHHPAVLLGLLIYGYASGVHSSRKIERATYDSVAFRYVAANTHPDHDTLATFRRRFLKEVEALFVQVLMLAREMKLLKLGHIALDGTKIDANASKHRALSWAHANKIEAQLRREVQTLLALAENSDRAALPDGMDVPAEIARREDRLSAIAQAKAKIEQRTAERHQGEQQEYEAKLAKRQAQRETGRKPRGKDPEPPRPGPKGGDQVNLTDEESRIMPVSGGGFEQSYNAQAGVDTETMRVITAHVSQACNDKREVVPTLEQIQALPSLLGEVHTLITDNGFFSQANVIACNDAGVQPLLALKRQEHHEPLMQRFAPDASAPDTTDPITQMAHRLSTQAGRSLYGLRKQTVEPVFGIIKRVMGWRQMSMRGLAKAQGEWSLVTMAWNIKRMHVLRAA